MIEPIFNCHTDDRVNQIIVKGKAEQFNWCSVFPPSKKTIGSKPCGFGEENKPNSPLGRGGMGWETRTPPSTLCGHPADLEDRLS